MPHDRRQERVEEVEIPVDLVFLEGTLTLPANPKGVILFSHGSGSSRYSPRNNFVAEALRDAGLGTLLFDLLTEEEDLVYANRFDIDLLTERLITATRWLTGKSSIGEQPIGLFGASTGAASALRAAAALGPIVKGVVSRGGRPDLVAATILHRVEAPTLLIVGGEDQEVIELNRWAYQQIGGEKEITIIPGATHLFEEPGALEEVAQRAARWFIDHFGVQEKGRDVRVA